MVVRHDPQFRTVVSDDDAGTGAGHFIRLAVSLAAVSVEIIIEGIEISRIVIIVNRFCGDRHDSGHRYINDLGDIQCLDGCGRSG